MYTDSKRPPTADDQYLGGENRVENMPLRDDDMALDDLNPNYKHVWMNNEKANGT